MSWNLNSGERPLRNRIVRTEIVEEKPEKETPLIARFPAWWGKVVDVLRAHPEAFQAVFQVLGAPT